MIFYTISMDKTQTIIRRMEILERRILFRKYILDFGNKSK